MKNLTKNEQELKKEMLIALDNITRLAELIKNNPENEQLKIEKENAYKKSFDILQTALGLAVSK